MEAGAHPDVRHSGELAGCATAHGLLLATGVDYQGATIGGAKSVARKPTVRAQTACRDCKRCTNSAFAEIGRKSGRTTAALLTVGMSELGFAMMKKCKLCGHQMSLHGATTAPPPTVAVETPVTSGYPATMPPAQPPEMETPEPERLETLERLANLRASGALTDEEFEAEKSKLLAEQEQFDVILESEGRRPSEVTKKIRNLTGLNLWQAVDLVGSAPQPLYKRVDKDTAYTVKAELEAVGATVIVRSLPR